MSNPSESQTEDDAVWCELADESDAEAQDTPADDAVDTTPPVEDKPRRSRAWTWLVLGFLWAVLSGYALHWLWMPKAVDAHLDRTPYRTSLLPYENACKRSEHFASAFQAAVGAGVHYDVCPETLPSLHPTGCTCACVYDSVAGFHVLVGTTGSCTERSHRAHATACVHEIASRLHEATVARRRQAGVFLFTIALAILTVYNALSC